MENDKMLSKSFMFMFLGLLLTAGVSWYCYDSNLMIDVLINYSALILIAELAVVIIFSLLFNKMSAGMVSLLYFVYAILTGITFSVYFYIYELGSITSIFLWTALLFLVLSFVGARTKLDLSGFGKILFTCLIVGLIMSVVNIFIGNSAMDIALNWVLLFVFGGITIYDVNRIQKLSYNYENDDKMYIYFAMQLYLDFINIFIRLLSLFAKEK